MKKAVAVPAVVASVVGVVNTVVSSVKDLIKQANKRRRSIVQKLFDAVVIKNLSGTTVAPSAEIPNLDELCADFITVRDSRTDPTGPAFSDDDIIYFGRELKAEQDFNANMLAEVQQVINVSRRINPLFIKDRIRFTALVLRCKTVLDFFNEELDRRDNDRKAVREAFVAQQAEQRELDRLEHEAFLQRQREKYAPKGPKQPNHAPHADKSVGKGLESLANASRAAGKFIAVRPIKKAELTALIGKEGMNTLKGKGEYTLPDFRKVISQKQGAITRYSIHE
jgi:hypothetical protein